MAVSRFLTIVSTVLFTLTLLGTSQAQQITKDWIHQRLQKDIEKKMERSDFGIEAAESAKNEHNHPLKNNSSDQGVSNTFEAESEVHAAINPTDSANMVVAAMKWTAGTFGSSLSFPVYYTRDFGQTWQLSNFSGINIPFLNLGGGDPVLAFDSDGTLYLTWLTVDFGFNPLIGIALHWAISTDGGATWRNQPTTIDQGAVLSLFGSAEPRLVDKQWCVVDRSDESPYKDNFYVSYTELNPVDTTYSILFKKKRANASALSPMPIEVSEEDIAFAQFSSIDVDREGNIHILFMGATLQDTTFNLYHAVSTDGGDSFQQTKITPLSVPCLFQENCDIVGIEASRMYPCPHLRVDKSGGIYDGSVYAVWTGDGLIEQKTPGTDIYFSRLEVGTNTWSVPSVLNQDGNLATYQFHPSLNVNEKGYVIATWYDRREDQNNISTHYYMTYSTDGGATFKQDFPVSTMPSDFSAIGDRNGDFGIGEYTQVISTPYQAIPFWADGRNNNGNIEIYMAKVPLLDQAAHLNEMPLSYEIRTIDNDVDLYRIFPNPTSGHTSLELALREETTVTVKVHDVSGRLLQEQSYGQLAQGTHLLELNVQDLPAGSYWCTIRTSAGRRSLPLLKE